MSYTAKEFFGGKYGLCSEFKKSIQNFLYALCRFHAVIGAIPCRIRGP